MVSGVVCLFCDFRPKRTSSRNREKWGSCDRRPSIICACVCVCVYVSACVCTVHVLLVIYAAQKYTHFLPFYANLMHMYSTVLMYNMYGVFFRK